LTDSVAVDAKRILLRYGAPIAILDKVSEAHRIEFAREIAKTVLPDREHRLRELLAHRGYADAVPVAKKGRGRKAKAPVDAPAKAHAPEPAKVAEKTKASGKAGAAGKAKAAAKANSTKAKVETTAKVASAGKAPAKGTPRAKAKARAKAKPKSGAARSAKPKAARKKR